MPRTTELTRLQHDHAWKWFELHAKQRMQMFNYFLIITGILANALVAAHKEGFRYVTIAIGVLGLFACAGFAVFDKRNRQMAAEGEDVLEKLEKDFIFPPDFEDQSGQRLGCLLTERRMLMREGQKRPWCASMLKHKFWIHTIQFLIGCFFISIIFLAVLG